MIRTLFQSISLLCVALGQPAFFSWLGPFASTLGFALFWRTLGGVSLQKIGKISFLWFFLVQLIQLSWMANLEYQGIYILVVYFILSAGLAWQFSFMTKIMHKASCVDWLFMAAMAALWTLFEWGRLHVLCGFAFNFLGLSLSCYNFPLQMASLFGVLGMSFWVMLSNLAAWRFFRVPSLFHGIKWVILVSIPYLYGFFYVGYYNQKHLQGNQDSYSILLMQTGVSPAQKYSLKGREQEFVSPMDQWDRILESISLQKETFLDLLVLPEAAVPFGLDLYIYTSKEVRSLFSRHFGEHVLSFFPPQKKPFALRERVSNAYILQTLANFFNAPVLSGLDYQSGDGEFYNSAFYFEPNSFFPKRYDKRVLLPLAEYMPFSFLNGLSQYYGIKDFFTRGRESKVFSESFLISPSICYEELFPSLMREGRLHGAQLFVNLSNDGYYPSSRLPIQHFTQGLIRGVENGVPLVRSCNTGVTAAVDCLGRVIGKLEDEKGSVENVSGCLFVQVPRDHHITGFVLWGEYPLILACFFFILVAAIRSFKKRFPSTQHSREMEIELDENRGSG